MEIWLDRRMIGWCIAAEMTPSGERVLEVLDLFIWPPFRGRGAARAAVTSLLEFSKSWEPIRMEFLVHSADAPQFGSVPAH